MLFPIPDSDSNAAPATGKGPPLTGRRVLTVSELTAAIRTALTDAFPGTLYVVGQISNFKRHASGHLYLTLKDDSGEVACVMWRSSAQTLKFQPQDGLEVLASCTLDLYERSGRYQLYLRSLEPRGVGALELAFRQLYQRLKAEGLFDPARKRKLPAFPQRIAVVTSPTGAAIRDILTTLRRRYPLVEIWFYPVRVQGPTTAEEIAQAIRLLNQWSPSLGGIQIAIVGRGGGSLEDLWAFNEEAVARAVRGSEIPIISAVGHESDFTICDWAADIRAATPTAAAELAVADRQDLIRTIQSLSGRLERRMTHHLALSRKTADGLRLRSWYQQPLTILAKRAQAVDDAATTMNQSFTLRFRQLENRIARCERWLNRIHPLQLVPRRRMDLAEAWGRLRWAIEMRMRYAEKRIAAVDGRLTTAGPGHRVYRMRDRLTDLFRRLSRGTERVCGRSEAALETQRTRLEALSYRSVLGRGFTITRLKQNGAVVRSVAGLHKGQVLSTETQDGTFDSRILDRDQPELF